MKKKTNGMNTRAIKRKLGLDSKQIENMIHDVNHLIEKDIFSNISNEKRFVTVDKKQLVSVLKGQVGELEKELKKIKNESKSSEVKKIEIPEIKINIS